MFIPLALGTFIALLIAPRRLFWQLLAAAFVSSAVARRPPSGTGSSLRRGSSPLR